MLNVKDLSLCETYWKVIADNSDLPIVPALALEELLENTFYLYPDSQIIWES